MFSSSRKPRFSLDLSIHEISNIPQVNGYCYIDILIKDGKKKVGHILLKGTANGDGSNSSSSVSLEKPESLHTASDVSASTSLRKIHNFKCTFNFDLNCNLKFSVKKKDNRISSKYLVMKVYYVSEQDVKKKDNEKLASNRKQRMELGKLELNLSEYINVEEPLNSKYLMNDSKVNSILNLTIFLNELPESQDFHTDLRVNDAGGRSLTSASTGASKSTQYRKPTTKHTKYNAPNLERTKIFSGFNDVIKPSDASPSLANLSVSSLPSEDSDKQNQLKNKSDILHNNDDEWVASNHRSSSDNGRTYSNSINGSNFANGTTGANVMMDPIVSNLYKKVLESTWDPELHCLLDFSPEECISDIFDNDGDGWNKYVSQTFGSWSNENDDEDNVDEFEGLINEATFREDLRSWSVGDTR